MAALAVRVSQPVLKAAADGQGETLLSCFAAPCAHLGRRAVSAEGEGSVLAPQSMSKHEKAEW